MLSWRDLGDPSVAGFEYRYRIDVDGSGWFPGVDVDGSGGVSVAEREATDGWAAVAGSHAETRSARVGGLVDGVGYVFAVRALGSGGGVGHVSAVRAVAGSPLARFAAAAGERAVVLSWQPLGASGTRGYRYRYRGLTDAGLPAGDWLPAGVAGDGEGSWTVVPGGVGATGVVVSGLADGVDYEVVVQTAGSGRARQSAVRVTAGVPLAGLTATPAGRAVELAWEPPGGGSVGVVGYQYRYSVDGGRSWFHRAAVTNREAPGWGPAEAVGGPSETGHTVKGLKAGVEYLFQVRAQGGSHGASDTVAVTVGNVLAGFAAASGDRHVVLSWANPGDSQITGYEYRYKQQAQPRWGPGVNDSTDPDDTDGWARMVGTSRLTASWKVTDGDTHPGPAVSDVVLVNGEEYAFEVRSTGEGKAREAAATVAVGEPLGALAAAPAAGRVVLSWGLNGDPLVTGYQYRQSRNGGRTWTAWRPNDHSTDQNLNQDELAKETAKLGSPAVTSYAVSGLTEGLIYTFQVRARGGSHGVSDTVTVAAVEAPPAPVVLGTDPGGPANNNRPVVHGAGTGDLHTIRIYRSPTCAGTPVATGFSSHIGGTFRVTATVGDDTATTFYATADNGNESACSTTSATYLEDSTAPTIRIHRNPDNPIGASEAVFFLTSSEAAATFECSLNQQAFASCGQLVRYTDLLPGQHTFQARATDTAGNTSRPATRAWAVTNTNPNP